MRSWLQAESTRKVAENAILAFAIAAVLAVAGLLLPAYRAVAVPAAAVEGAFAALLLVYCAVVARRAPARPA